MGRFIDNGYIESLQAEQFGFSGDGSNCAYKDTATGDAFCYFRAAGTKRKFVFNQMMPVSFVTRQLTADTNKVDPRPNG